jgi:hypothetical protein
VQVVVSRAASPGLPEYIRTFYARLAILSFESFGVHPACLGRLGPWAVYNALYALVLSLLVAQLALHVNWRRLCGCYLCGLGARRTAQVLTPHLAGGTGGDDDRPDHVRIKAAMDAAGSAAAAAAADAAPTTTAAADAAEGGVHGGVARAAVITARAPPPRGSLTRAGSAFGYASPLGKAARRSADGRTPASSSSSASAPSPGGFPVGSVPPGGAGGLRTPTLSAGAAALAALPPAQRFGARFEAWKPTLRRGLFMALTLLYPATTAPVLGNLTCMPQRVTVAVYRTMESDGSSLVPYGIPYAPRTVPLTSLSAYLRGDPDAATVVTVRVLARDPYVVCREGRHAGVYAFSLFMLLVYVIGYPLGSLLWVWRRVWQLAGSEPGRRAADGSGSGDSSKGANGASKGTGGDAPSPTALPMPPLAAAAEADRHRQWAYVMDAGNWLLRAYRAVAVLLCCAGTRHVRGSATPFAASLRRRRTREARDGVVMVDSPMVQAGAAAHGKGGGAGGGDAQALAAAAAPGVVTASDVIDGCAALTSSGGLGHFTGSEYRPSTFWFRQLDLCVLLALTAAVELLPVPTSVSSAVAKSLIVWAVLAVAASYFVAQRPFPPGAGWKLFAKVYHLLLLMAITALNLTTWLIHVARPAAGIAAFRAAAAASAGAGGGGLTSSVDVCSEAWLAADAPSAAASPSPSPGANATATAAAAAVVVAATSSTAPAAFSRSQLDSLCAARNGLSVATFVLSLLFFLIIIVGFILSLYEGIEAQASAAKAAAAAAARAAAEKAAADKAAADKAALRPLQLSTYKTDASRAGVGSTSNSVASAGGGGGGDRVARSVQSIGDVDSTSAGGGDTARVVVDAPHPQLVIAVPSAAAVDGATPPLPYVDDDDVAVASVAPASAGKRWGAAAVFASGAASSRGGGGLLASTRNLFGPQRPSTTPRLTSQPTPVGGTASLPALSPLSQQRGTSGTGTPAVGGAGASSVTGADGDVVFDRVNTLYLQQHGGGASGAATPADGAPAFRAARISGPATPAAAAGSGAATSAITGADGDVVFDRVNTLFLQQHRSGGGSEGATASGSGSA